MARPLVTYPDPEHLVVDVLAAALADEDCTVGVGLPDGWQIDRTAPENTSPPHVQVALDGTPVDEHPVALRCTIRITAWADNPTPAKALVLLAHGHLLATAGNDDGLSTVSPLTGPLPAHDDDHDADLASCTLRVRVRSTPITS